MNRSTDAANKAAEPDLYIQDRVGDNARGLLFGFDTAIINGAIIFLKQQSGWNDGQN
jgi:hypothetical protein